MRTLPMLWPTLVGKKASGGEKRFENVVVCVKRVLHQHYIYITV